MLEILSHQYLKNFLRDQSINWEHIYSFGRIISKCFKNIIFLSVRTRVESSFLKKREIKIAGNQLWVEKISELIRYVESFSIHLEMILPKEYTCSHLILWFLKKFFKYWWLKISSIYNLFNFKYIQKFMNLIYKKLLWI